MNRDRTEYTQLVEGSCWWCGAPADSREHRYKATDVIREWGKEPAKNQAIGNFGGQHLPLRGAKANVLKFGMSMCAPCNNARSQAFDRAQVLLMDWVAANEELVLDERQIDLKRVYGGRWRERARDMARYFLKHACCQLADQLKAGEVWLGNDVLEFLDGDPRWPTSLTAEFYIDTSLLLRTDLQELANGSRGYFSTSRIDTRLDDASGQLVGPQSRLCWRWFSFAWQLHSFDHRSDPTTQRHLELRALPSYQPEHHQPMRQQLLETGGELAAKRIRQGLL